MEKSSILFITNAYNTFVLRDVGILEKKWRVRRFTYTGKTDLASNLRAQATLLFWLLRHMNGAEALYIWFADYHAFLPVLFARIFRKKVFLVEGGYDTANIPEIAYGSHTRRLRSACSRYAMRHATLNLPVAETLTPEITALAPRARVRHLYTGYDPGSFTPAGKKEKLVLTVAGSNTLQRIRLKGVDIFLRAARRLPHYRFLVAGIDEAGQKLLDNVPANVEITGRVSQETLITFYRKTSVYAQFSMREGLPNAVCEAMLCECAPVGFDNGGIPLAIGDAGIVLKDRSMESIAEALKKAMESQKTLGPRARARIIREYPLERREKALLKIVAETPLRHDVRQNGKK